MEGGGVGWGVTCTVCVCVCDTRSIEPNLQGKARREVEEKVVQ